MALSSVVRSDSRDIECSANEFMRLLGLGQCALHGDGLLDVDILKIFVQICRIAAQDKRRTVTAIWKLMEIRDLPSGA
jgi:hypothetical protein